MEHAALRQPACFAYSTTQHKICVLLVVQNKRT